MFYSYNSILIKYLNLCLAIYNVVNLEASISHISICLMFSRRVKTSKASGTVCAVCRKNVVGERTSQNGLPRFKENHFDDNDSPVIGRLSDWWRCDGLHRSTRELTIMMRLNQSTSRLAQHLPMFNDWVDVGCYCWGKMTPFRQCREQKKMP